MLDGCSPSHDAALDIQAEMSGDSRSNGPIDGGWGILDFWGSREQFDSFVAERVGPAAAAAGVTAPPEIHGFPVHEYLLGS